MSLTLVTNNNQKDDDSDHLSRLSCGCCDWHLGWIAGFDGVGVVEALCEDCVEHQ